MAPARCRKLRSTGRSVGREKYPARDSRRFGLTGSFVTGFDHAMGTFTAIGADEGIGESDIAGYTETVAEEASLGVTMTSCPGSAKDGSAAEWAVSGVG